MCLACVGSCPEAAILDNMEAPQVRFIESKCVQCGICAATCPEHAITLTPRLDLTPAAKAPRVLNEAAIFTCIRCGKPLGTDKMIATMLGKLSGAFDVCRTGCARPAQDVRRLPRRRPHQEREQRGHPRTLTPLEAAPVTLTHRLEPEDEARAQFYALLARLVRARSRRVVAGGDRRQRALGRIRGQSSCDRMEYADPGQPGDGCRGGGTGIHRCVRRRRQEPRQPARLALDHRDS